MNRIKLRKKRLLGAVALMVALCASLAAPCTAFADNKSPEIGWDSNPKIPGYHLSAPGLPESFAKREGGALLYYTKDGNSDAVYCIERDMDDADFQFTESDASNRSLTAEQQEWLAYILKNGAKKYVSGDLALNKFQVATQLAVWMVTERDGDKDTGPHIYLDEKRWDKYLYKASGDVAPKDAFAPTAEIGRMARKLLLDAQKKAPRLIPSFLVDVKDAPLEFYTASTNATNQNELHIEDANQVLRVEMGDGTLKLHDPKGLDVKVRADADILDIHGLTAQEETLLFDFSVGGKLVYLTPYHTDKRYQKMARFISDNSDSTVLHVKLLKKEAVTPPPPVVVTPPAIITPPAVTTPPPVVITPPAIVTPPAVTTPPVVTPPPGVTTPPSKPPGPGTGIVPPPPKTETPPAPPKTENPPTPPQPPTPSDKPPEPPLYTVDDGRTPSGAKELNDNMNVGTVKPSGKLPKTGGVLEQQSAHGGAANGELPVGEAGAAALAAAGMGMALYLNRKRNRG